MSDKFTPDEVKFIHELSTLTVTIPIAQAAKLAEVWQSVVAKVKANAETASQDD